MNVEIGNGSRSFISGNICFKFSVQLTCQVIRKHQTKKMVFVCRSTKLSLFTKASCVSPLSFLTGEVVGEELNHTTARKPSLKIIQYSLELTKNTLSSTVESM